MIVVEVIQSQCGFNSHHLLQRIPAWKAIRLLKAARTSIPTTTLSLLLLSQQILLPDTFNSWCIKDIRDPRRHVGHGLKSTLKLGSVLTESVRTTPVFI